jgi:hypothetical protein
LISKERLTFAGAETCISCNLFSPRPEEQNEFDRC